MNIEAVAFSKAIWNSSSIQALSVEIRYIIWVFRLKKTTPKPNFKILAEIPFSSNDKVLFPQIEAGNWQLFTKTIFFSFLSPFPYSLISK